MGGMETGGAEEEQVKGHTACGSEDAWRVHPCVRTHTQKHTHPDQHPGQEQDAEALPAHPPAPGMSSSHPQTVLWLLIQKQVVSALNPGTGCYRPPAGPCGSLSESLGHPWGEPGG